jgi:cyanate permease
MLSEYTRALAVVILLSGLTLRTHRTSWHPILREVRGCVEAWATLLSLVAVKLTRRWTILAPLYSALAFKPFLHLHNSNLRCT